MISNIEKRNLTRRIASTAYNAINEYLKSEDQLVVDSEGTVGMKSTPVDMEKMCKALEEARNQIQLLHANIEELESLNKFKEFDVVKWTPNAKNLSFSGYARLEESYIVKLMAYRIKDGKCQWLQIGEDSKSEDINLTEEFDWVDEADLQKI